ncbi:MAG: hypothetical protein ACK4WC_12005 [Rubrimonas sp.]
MTATALGISEGAPRPLCATRNGAGVNVAGFSAHATAVEQRVFHPSGRRGIVRRRLPEYTDKVRHGHFPDLLPGDPDRLPVDGPYAPGAGHGFNPNTLLIDPCAKALEGDLRWRDACFGYRIGHPRADLSFDRRHGARAMPERRIVETPRAASPGSPPRSRGDSRCAAPSAARW